MIAKEIEAILAAQDVGDGDVDVDGVIEAFERTRELFAEPICRLGGSDYLEPLFEAAQLGLDEGHDNDSFDASLSDIAHAEPEKCRTKLEELLARADFKHREAAMWLLESCKTNKHGWDGLTLLAASGGRAVVVAIGASRGRRR